MGRSRGRRSQGSSRQNMIACPDRVLQEFFIQSEEDFVHYDMARSGDVCLDIQYSFTEFFGQPPDEVAFPGGHPVGIDEPPIAFV